MTKPNESAKSFRGVITLRPRRFTYLGRESILALDRSDVQLRVGVLEGVAHGLEFGHHVL